MLTLHMEKIELCTKDNYNTLVEIWERSVRATHLFLSETDILDIRDSLIPMYFKSVSLYVIYEENVISGFIGLSGSSIEMLFVDPSCMGKGLGTQLIKFAKSLGADSVDVNEQNPRALNFYLANGFKVVSRDEYDADGRHYPILHLSL